MDRLRQLRSAAKTERRWITDAEKDERYNRAQESRDRSLGNTILANFHHEEAEWDKEAVKKRKGILENIKRRM